MEKLSKSKFFLPFMGIICGFINGLLGAGGGIATVFALNFAIGDKISDKRDIFANALCVMLPISALTCIFYAFSGNISLDGIGIYAIPAILGGLLGGFLLGKLKLGILKKIFSLLVIYSGLSLLIK